MSAKLTLGEPEAMMTAATMAEVEVTDKLGRMIKMRDPGPLAQYHIVEVVGSERAKNEVWMGMVMPILFVTEIGGEPAFFPQSYGELEATITRLGHDGLTAVMTEFQKTWGGKEAVEKDRDAIKK